jgi:hypothetical protein
MVNGTSGESIRYSEKLILGTYESKQDLGVTYYSLPQIIDNESKYVKLTAKPRYIYNKLFAEATGDKEYWTAKDIALYKMKSLAAFKEAIDLNKWRYLILYRGSEFFNRVEYAEFTDSIIDGGGGNVSAKISES